VYQKSNIFFGIETTVLFLKPFSYCPFSIFEFAKKIFIAIIAKRLADGLL